MRFDLARGGNTFDAHRLVHLAKAHGVQDAMKERLMRAYSPRASPSATATTLARLALEVGLPEDDVRDVLATDRYAAEVREDERTGHVASGSPPCPSSSSIAGSAPRARTRPRRCGELLRRGWEARVPA